MAADENPIAELHEAVAENPVKAAGAVAVIDTGVNDMANVTDLFPCTRDTQPMKTDTVQKWHS